jgi:DNA-binding transcriptional ArsR family regulator
VLLEEPDRVLLALSPVRRTLLERLREPSSASRLAEQLGLSRQRVNYHLRALEEAGLVDLVETRRRRGFTERVLAARPDGFVVDPALMAASDADRIGIAAQDAHASEHLMDVAAGVVRDVARLQTAAQRSGKRLLTFTVETEVRLSAPSDVERLAERLADAVRMAVAEFDAPGGRPHRLVAGALPSITEEEES